MVKTVSVLFVRVFFEVQAFSASIYLFEANNGGTGAGCLLFHDGGPYHVETRPLICPANQWTGFYMIGTFVMKKIRVFGARTGGTGMLSMITF